MCSKEATGNEHVPPLCLFPEKKDIQSGLEQRKNLITVPSCDEHNQRKSKDDEYLYWMLSMNLPANEIAKNHFSTKIMRGITRTLNSDKKGLIYNILAKTSPVTVVEKDEKIHQTIAIDIDGPRFDSALSHIARGLYFHHFHDRWVGDVRIQADFILPSLRDQEQNERSAELAKGADCLFAECEFYGANPDVFKYQVLDGGSDKLMRLHFYEGCRVTVFFVNRSSDLCELVD